MPYLSALFRRRERIVRVGGKKIEESVHGRIVNKVSAGSFEEFVKIEGPLKFFPIYGAVLKLGKHHGAGAIGKHIQNWHIGIGVFARAGPVPFGFLLIGIRPVEDRIFGEPIVRQGLEGSA